MTTDVVHVPMPEHDDLGPAMRALNERQRKFVVLYFHTGSRERAALQAGYAGGTDDPKALNLLGVSAFSVWHQPKVQAAIKEFGEQCVLAGLVPLAFVALENALKMGDVKEQTKAAQIVMDRTGFHAKSETIVRQPDKDRVAQIREIVRLCKLQGLDPRTLIGGAVDFVDADFEVLDGKKPELNEGTGGLAMSQAPMIWIDEASEVPSHLWETCPRAPTVKAIWQALPKPVVKEPDLMYYRGRWVGKYEDLR